MLVKVEVEQEGERVNGTLFNRVQIQKKKNRNLEKFLLSKHEKQRLILSNKPLRQRCGWTWLLSVHRTLLGPLASCFLQQEEQIGYIKLNGTF